MKEEVLFRIVFGILIAIVMVFLRIIPAIRSIRTKTKLTPNKEAVNNEGLSSFILRVVLGILLFVFIILYFINPSFMEILHVNILIWIRWIGVSISILGVSFWIYSQYVLDKYWSPQLQVQKEHKIITSGPYKSIRHPIYSSMFLWCIGIALFTANIGWILFAAICILFLLIRVPKEEKMMIEQFGDEYKKYMQITGRFLPRFR